MASHIASLWNRGLGQLENGLLQVLHTLKLYHNHHFFEVYCLYDVLLYKIQHLFIKIHFSIAPMWTDAESNFACLQSAFSLTIRLVLIPVRAIANEVVPSRAWVTRVVTLQWKHRLQKIFLRPQYTFKLSFPKTPFSPSVSLDHLQEKMNFSSFL